MPMEDGHLDGFIDIDTQVRAQALHGSLLCMYIFIDCMLLITLVSEGFAEFIYSWSVSRKIEIQVSQARCDPLFLLPSS